MRINKVSIVIAAVLLISSAPHALADDAAIDRTARVEQIKARWNPIFEQQYAQLTGLALKAKQDSVVYKNYKFLLDDFLHVRQVIDAALNSATGDIEAAAAYAEEETGEFNMTIPELAQQVAKIKTISCVKGKTVKKVTGTAPKCPSGYKKK